MSPKMPMSKHYIVAKKRVFQSKSPLNSKLAKVRKIERLTNYGSQHTDSTQDQEDIYSTNYHHTFN